MTSTVRDAAAPFQAARNPRLLFASMAVARLSPYLAVWVVYLTDYWGLSLAQVGIMEMFFQAVKVAGQIPAGIRGPAWCGAC